MLIDAIFRSNSLENPAVPITVEAAEKERAEFYHFAITDGWMSRNEARAFEDMNPKDGLDEMLVSVNASRPAKSTTQENTQDE